MATVLMPRALQVRITRCEISPRLAINTLSNGFVERHLRAIDDTAREGREVREEESNRNMVALFCCCFLVGVSFANCVGAICRIFRLNRSAWRAFPIKGYVNFNLVYFSKILSC